MVLEADKIGNSSFHLYVALGSDEVNHLIKLLTLSTKPCVPALKHGFHHSLFAAAFVAFTVLGGLPAMMRHFLVVSRPFPGRSGRCRMGQTLGAPPVPSLERCSPAPAPHSLTSNQLLISGGLYLL